MPLRLGLAGVSRKLDGLAALGASIVAIDADVTLWDPRHPRPEGRVIQFLDVREDDYFVVHPAAMGLTGVRADAYAGDVHAVASALAWVAHGAPRPERGGIFLGALGTAWNRVPIGAPIAIEERCVVGRGRGCDLIVRHGAHSDQNVCARRHAMLERTAEGIRLTDLQSTNGTFVDGVLVADAVLVGAGEEVAFAGVFRLAICG